MPEILNTPMDELKEVELAQLELQQLQHSTNIASNNLRRKQIMLELATLEKNDAASKSALDQIKTRVQDFNKE